MKTMLRALFALAVPLVMAACCDDGVQARAFVGHLTEAECARKANEPDAPISIVCPGTEVTLCWASNVDETNITIDPDEGGQSGPNDDRGALYLTPHADTKIVVEAGCVSTTKKIMVLNEPRTATFDARWDGECNKLGYTLNPAFVDDKVLALDVTAQWSPIMGTGGGDMQLCKSPPFLDGSHPIELFFFSIAVPFMQTPFSNPHKAVGDWLYALTDPACADSFKCSKDTAEPFDMTLTCPAL
ncbi:MAG TPA: hypothetical protein VK698_35955 [Kofleriaceae bacterium]|nr:hypothetical protein [Kofleriaceae bacterium]